MNDVLCIHKYLDTYYIHSLIVRLIKHKDHHDVLSLVTLYSEAGVPVCGRCAAAAWGLGVSHHNTGAGEEIRGEEPRPDPPSTHCRDTDTGTYTKIWYLEKIHDMMHDILILRQLSTICQQPVDVRNVPEQWTLFMIKTCLGIKTFHISCFANKYV